MSNNDYIDEVAARGAYFTEAINQLLAAINCPKNIRQFLDTLIGYADGKTQFSVFDIVLGLRADSDRSKDAATKWVQRNRKNLLDWQDENNIVLVEYKRGLIDKNNNKIPSKYHLHLTEYVNPILAEAQKSARWNKSPHAAIDRAARDYVSELVDAPIFFKPRAQKPKDTQKEISTRLKQANTQLEKVSDIISNLIMEGKLDLTKEHSELWEILKLSVDDLSSYFEEDEDY